MRKSRELVNVKGKPGPLPSRLAVYACFIDTVCAYTLGASFSQRLDVQDSCASIRAIVPINFGDQDDQS